MLPSPPPHTMNPLEFWNSEITFASHVRDVLFSTYFIGLFSFWFSVSLSLARFPLLSLFLYFVFYVRTCSALLFLLSLVWLCACVSLVVDFFSLFLSHDVSFNFFVVFGASLRSQPVVVVSCCDSVQHTTLSVSTSVESSRVISTHRESKRYFILFHFLLCCCYMAPTLQYMHTTV